MLSIDVRKQLGSFRLEARFEAPALGVTALFGRSGAGKSTLVNLIAGITRPDSGRVQLAATVFCDTAKGHHRPVEERHIGYVFQDARLFPHLRVGANLRYGLRRARGRARVDFAQVVELLGLGDLLHRWPHALSGGERQRVALGRAFLSQPDLLLMDEPLANLDAPRKTEVLAYIERLREDFGIPILYVSHALDEVVRLADHLVVLAEGQVVASGPLLELAGQPQLQPHLGRFEAGTVLECVVRRHDPEFQITVLDFGDGQLQVPMLDALPGTRLRTRLRARDIGIALSRPADISIMNWLSGTVATLTPGDGPFSDVAVRVGSTIVHALITRESCARLGLAVGRPVWAMIKTVALDSRAVGFTRRSRPPTAGKL